MSGIFIRVSVYALAALLLAGVCATCSTKRQKSFTGPDWPGPAVSDVQVSPKHGPYFSGDTVTFSVEAAPTFPNSPGELAFNWDIGQIGSIKSGQGTNTINVMLGYLVSASGSVRVRETVSPGVWKETTENFKIELSSYIDDGHLINIYSLTYNPQTHVVTATYSSWSGEEEIAVTWSVTEGAITPIENDNFRATAVFEAPVGKTGTAKVVFTAWVVYYGPSASFSDAIDIVFKNDPFLTFEDSVFLIAPMTVRAGEQYDVSIYAWPSPAKPLGNLNAVRLLVDQSKAVAQSINRGGFFDGFDGIYFPPLLIQQPTFLDVGINFGGGTTMSFTRGILATVTFVSLSPGDVTFDIMGYDGAQNRTFYSDLDGKTYTFSTIGKDYGSGFVTSKVVVNVK